MPEFSDKPGFAFPGPPPQEVIDYFQAKGWKIGFDWRDVWAEEHAYAFTVAKAMELDVLRTIRASLDQAITEGIPYRQWAKDLQSELERLGWWGKQEMVDPVTGQTIHAQLGSPERLKTIYDANLRSARAAGQWQRIQRSKRTHPYLLYLLGPSRVHREQHSGWSGLLLPVDSPWWASHMPPNGWGCKCYVRQVTERQAQRLREKGLSVKGEPIRDKDGNLTGRHHRERIKVRTTPPKDSTFEWVNKRTGEVLRVPTGIDPGWHTNPGAVREAAIAAKAAELDIKKREL